MTKITEISVPGFEKVIEAVNKEAGLHCFIAIHNTTLGPALGGTRVYPYTDREAALKDVLRLAEGMTYKSSVAKVGLGGGKAVIIADHYTQKTEKLLRAYAGVINYLQGLYITAEDVGTTTSDIALIRETTPHVVGLPLHQGSGDPSPFTAWGVFRGIEAVCQTLFGSPSVKGRTVAVQGLGKVGSLVAGILFWHGAHLILSDVRSDQTDELAKMYGAKAVSPQDIHRVKCDIFCPSAMGGILNEKSILELNCLGVAGSANNQLGEAQDGHRLMKKGILYAPDFVINSGGLINVSGEIDPNGYQAEKSRDKIDNLYDILISLFKRAKEEARPTAEVALDMARENLKNKTGKRTAPVIHTPPMREFLAPCQI